MPLTLDRTKISIDFSTSTAKPDLFHNDTVAIAHLTSGFNPEAASEAWNAFGNVNVSGTDSANELDFGFIQLGQQVELFVEYSGAQLAGGSVLLKPAEPPTWKDPTELLDSKVGQRPWTRAVKRFKITNGLLTATTGDHPMLKVALKTTNKTTNADNFLRLIVDKRRFWTIFTKKEKATTPQNEYLSHFVWDLVNQYEFKWRGGKPQPINRAKITFGKEIAGAPDDGDIRKLLIESNQNGPDYNEIARAAMVSAAAFGAPPNREDRKERFLSTPKDFFA